MPAYPAALSFWVLLAARPWVPVPLRTWIAALWSGVGGASVVVVGDGDGVGSWDGVGADEGAAAPLC